ncbi:hypothetical protein CPAV1605_1476 [seawater metagenome]|uniref:Uncharacterized protein n=1 Tax=seawater metagenome TaxID=1561972 RepID=A0A5E8CKG6_9ZZZZ
MSDIFDIPDDKPKKQKREMSPEAKEKLLERLRAGREKAKAKRTEQAKLKKEEVVEAPVEVPVEAPVEVSVEKDDNNLDDDDVRVLANQIEELEKQVSEKKKRTYKKRDGVMINKAKISREKYINDTVARKVAEQMSKMNTPKPAVVKQQVQFQTPKPAPVPVKKPSKFAGGIKPIWAVGFDI